MTIEHANRDRILIVEDDEAMRGFLEEELVAAGFACQTASDGHEALARMGAVAFDAVVSDVMMPGMTGTALLERVRQVSPDLPVVLMTAFGTIESAVGAMRAGAYHYVSKPFKIETLTATLHAALEERRLRVAAKAALDPVASGGSGLVAQSAAMKRMLVLLARAAGADSPVLIRGESGTGKELVARALHEQSPRRERAFVPINCSAIPETLLESLLFGHRRGAFTDAREDRAGLFQQADGGTLFLDEIGDMPASLQAKLLRVLQDSEVLPLGASTPVHVDVRIVAATHRDLEAMCEQGTFRRDLFYRLDVVPLVIPPLRERPEDLLPMVAHLLAKHAPRLGREGITLSKEAIELLRRHSWPGNVRELENAIERALVLGEGDPIRPEDLPALLRPKSAAAEPQGVLSMSEMERAQVVKALRLVGGNKAAAARLLGLDRKTLYRKIELYQIEE